MNFIELYNAETKQAILIDFEDVGFFWPCSGGYTQLVMKRRQRGCEVGVVVAQSFSAVWNMLKANTPLASFRFLNVISCSTGDPFAISLDMIQAVYDHGEYTALATHPNWFGRRYSYDVADSFRSVVSMISEMQSRSKNVNVAVFGR